VIMKLMNFRNKFFLLLLTIFFPFVLSAQKHTIKALAEVPVQVGVGYEGFVSKRFSISVQGGVLTEPNSTLIINILEKLGTTPEIIDIIEESCYFWLV
jgi:hypothetical protein